MKPAGVVPLIGLLALAACGGTENTDTVEVKAEPAAVAAEVALALTIAEDI